MSCSQPDAAGGEAGQQRAVFGADGRGSVLNPQVRRGALQQGRLDEARGREGIHRQVRRGGHARGVLVTRPSMDVTVLPRELKVATSG